MKMKKEEKNRRKEILNIGCVLQKEYEKVGKKITKAAGAFVSL